jgi:hypothetical protein
MSRKYFKPSVVNDYMIRWSINNEMFFNFQFKNLLLSLLDFVSCSCSIDDSKSVPSTNRKFSSIHPAMGS